MRVRQKLKLSPLFFCLLVVIVTVGLAAVTSQNGSIGGKLVLQQPAPQSGPPTGTANTAETNTRFGCGSDPGNQGNAEAPAVYTSIDFGCKGDACAKQQPVTYCKAAHDGIIDLLFAIIRFLSDGVGLVVVASIIVGGIQYMTSRGDPNATNKAIGRLTSAVIALVIFIFAYAILNYVVPGFFN